MSASLIRSVKYRAFGILLNNSQAKTNQLVYPGGVVSVTLPPEENDLPPEEIPLEILRESAHAMVLEKPAGLVMHPTLSHKGGTMANGFAALMAKRGQGIPFRPVGRLDANTSGLILCALNPYAAPILSSNFTKMYFALVQGTMPSTYGTIEAPIESCPDSAIKQQVAPGGKYAKTNYQVLEVGQGASFVAVWPLTGRTHQIRVHFAHLGNPLLGDWLYGGPQELLQRQALHCAGLRFTEPGEKPCQIQSQLPQDLQQAAASLGIALPSKEKVIFSL